MCRHFTVSMLMTRLASGGHCGSIRTPELGPCSIMGWAGKSARGLWQWGSHLPIPGNSAAQHLYKWLSCTSERYLLPICLALSPVENIILLHYLYMAVGLHSHKGKKKKCCSKCDIQPSLLLCGAVFPFWRSMGGHFYFISDADQKKSIGEVWLSMGPQGVFPHMKIFSQGHKQDTWWMDFSSFFYFYFLCNKRSTSLSMAEYHAVSWWVILNQNIWIINHSKYDIFIGKMSNQVWGFKNASKFKWKRTYCVFFYFI